MTALLTTSREYQVIQHEAELARHRGFASWLVGKITALVTGK